MRSAGSRPCAPTSPAGSCPPSRTTVGSSTPSCSCSPSTTDSASTRCRSTGSTTPTAGCTSTRTALDDLRGTARLARAFAAGRGRLELGPDGPPAARGRLRTRLVSFATIGAISTIVSLVLYLADPGRARRGRRERRSRSSATFVGNTWANARFTAGVRRPQWRLVGAVYVGSLAVTSAALLVVIATGGGLAPPRWRCCSSPGWPSPSAASPSCAPTRTPTGTRPEPAPPDPTGPDMSSTTLIPPSSPPTPDAVAGDDSSRAPGAGAPARTRLQRMWRGPETDPSVGATRRCSRCSPRPRCSTSGASERRAGRTRTTRRRCRPRRRAGRRSSTARPTRRTSSRSTRRRCPSGRWRSRRGSSA